MCALKQSPELLLKSGCFRPKDRKVFLFFTTGIKVWKSDHEKCKDLQFTYKVVACSSDFMKSMRESKQKQNLEYLCC